MKAGWKIKRLGELCDVTAGQSPEGRFYNSKGAGMPFYQGKKDFGEIFIKPASNWTTEITKTAREGDILMSVRAPVGPINFATEEICIGRGLASIRAGLAIDRHFLFYQLLHLQPEISGKEGAVFASINKSEIEALRLVLPPLAEQKRIVALLDEAFAGIDEAKAKAVESLVNKQTLFKSQLTSVFTKHGSSWPHEELGALTNTESPITYGVIKPGDEGEVLFVRGGDLVGGRVRLTQLRTITKTVSDQYARTLLKGGELLICLVGQPGQVAVAPDSLAGANIARQVGLIRLRENMNPDFIKYFLQSPPGAEKLGAKESGSVQQVINLGELRGISVPCPDITQQNLVVRGILTLEAEIQDLSKLAESKISALKELKTSLLTQAFAGELNA